jgi:hypothetical protein
MIGWRPRLTTVVALISLALILGGMCISYSPSVTAMPLGTMVDATRPVRDSPQSAPDILFAAGAILAGVFIVVYIATMSTGGPRRKRIE